MSPDGGNRYLLAVSGSSFLMDLEAQRMLVAIRQMLAEPGTSQRSIAEQLGVSQGAVRQWLAGYPEPKRDKVRRFATTFGIRKEYFEDASLGEHPDHRAFVGREVAREGRSAPEVEKFIEERGVSAEAATFLRSIFNGGGHPSTTLVTIAYNEWMAEQAGRATNPRESLNKPIDEERGQRALPPTRRRK